MIYRPHEYQSFATDFILIHDACGCFLECGLGKTVISLDAVNDLMFDSFDVVKVLVIAPLRVARDTWSRECEKWEHLKHIRISKILGNEEERIRAIKSKAEVYIINRENVEWLVEYHGAKWPYDMVIIDELSSFKSPQAKRFKALRKVRPLIKRVVGLTGTPAPNSLIDLWSEVYLLDRGERLGKTLTGYRDRYFLPDKRNKEIIYTYKAKDDAEAAIYERISDICVSMKACDYLDMPERIDNYVQVKMSTKEEALYKKLEREMLLSFEDGDIDAVNAAALSNKLLQMANGAVYDENGAVKSIHDRKLEALEDLVESANGKPVLVYYAYKHDKDRILQVFKKKVRQIDSSQDITDWNSGEIEIAIAHPASTGHGLNLQEGGHIIIWFGLTWSLELYQQANARIHRQGQTETVVVHHIITTGTVDEQVVSSLERKDVGQGALINAVKARINK
jgi:SNF2 family DNA or RNA helicase